MQSAWFESTLLRALKFLQIKEGGDLISREKQFFIISEFFGPLFCSSILKVLLTQILHHSLDFNAYCMIHEYFSQTLLIFTN